MAAQKQDDQLERTFSSYVRIQVVVRKTYLGRWTIGRSGERGSGISVLPARYDDDDDDSKPDVLHLNFIFGHFLPLVEGFSKYIPLYLHCSAFSSRREIKNKGKNKLCQSELFNINQESLFAFHFTLIPFEKPRVEIFQPPTDKYPGRLLSLE